jgi:glutathione S-transferase
MTHTLVQFPYSPWSRRARLALALEGIAHRCETYIVGVSEPWLRLRARRPFASVTIPCLLTDDGEAICDSFAIARWAHARGSAKLCPEAHLPAITEVVDLADRALAAGRLRSVHTLLTDRAGLAEQVPPGLRFLGPLGVPTASFFARRLAHKYGHLVEGAPEVAERDALDRLVERVRGRTHLVGETLTFADLAAASALGFIAPPDRTVVGPRTLSAFIGDGPTEADRDLLAWRDDLDRRIADLLR